MSKCRALLSLQPIKQPDAVQLDKMISAKVHELMRFPFTPQTNVLTLPLTHHGLDFPSVARVNAGIAVEGLMRDLNHHIQAYKVVARITYAEWTCRYNNCGNTVDGGGLQRKFTHLFSKIPATWLIAHSLMSSTTPKLSLRHTDVSYILDGEVSLIHMMNICKAHNLQVIDRVAINCLARVGLTLLKHIGRWGKDLCGRWHFEAHNKPEAGTTQWTDATNRSWDKVILMMKSARIGWMFQGGEELLLNREDRRREAENLVKTLAHLLEHPPSSHSIRGKGWASDGSMVPASAGIMEEKFVTAALTGPVTMVMKLGGRNSNILHGEVFGLIMGHILSTPDCDDVLFTDHLNSVRFLQDMRTNINQEKALRYRNGRSYFRWLSLLSKETGLRVEYTKGHSNEITQDSKLNAEADHFAVAAQKQFHSIPLAPPPTFTMNDFTYYRELDGWIESNIRIFIDQLLTQKIAMSLSLGHHQRMATWLYQKPNPPSYVYHKATSAYTAAVQLYARSGQLATAEKVEDCQADGNGGRCRLGCHEVEDEHHVFVGCLEFNEWRVQAGKQLRKVVEERLIKMKVGDGDKAELLSKAEFFYIDDPTIWPLKESRYYLGHVPKLSNLLPKSWSGLGKWQEERMIHAIYCEWHNAGVRLALRIYEELQQHVTCSWDQERKSGRK